LPGVNALAYFDEEKKLNNVVHRKEVADWMLEVCEDRNCNPEVFSLAMNYLVTKP
jgi:hypothetical protein